MLIDDAVALHEAGIQLLLLEAVPPEVGKFITELLPIPVYGIGAGMHTDGQLLIISDLIGQFQAFTPKFVKKYANVAEVVTDALKAYGEEVRAGSFPAESHCYRMIEGEFEKFEKMAKQYKRPE
jgi:3-methyl-2-oxobutanoate hydroxymethyltransferase